MNITINGEKRSLANIATLDDLLAHLQLPPETVVVELNTKIIQPDAYISTALTEGDTIELIRFVGGG